MPWCSVFFLIMYTCMQCTWYYSRWKRQCQWVISSCLYGTIQWRRASLCRYMHVNIYWNKRVKQNAIVMHTTVTFGCNQKSVTCESEPGFDNLVLWCSKEDTTLIITRISNSQIIIQSVLGVKLVQVSIILTNYFVWSAFIFERNWNYYINLLLYHKKLPSGNFS